MPIDTIPTSHSDGSQIHQACAWVLHQLAHCNPLSVATLCQQATYQFRSVPIAGNNEFQDLRGYEEPDLPGGELILERDTLVKLVTESYAVLIEQRAQANLRAQALHDPAAPWHPLKYYRSS